VATELREGGRMMTAVHALLAAVLAANAAVEIFAIARIPER